MDLQQIRKNISANLYELRRQFLADIKQMLDNSRLYNGDNHIITKAARQVRIKQNFKNRKSLGFRVGFETFDRK